MSIVKFSSPGFDKARFIQILKKEGLDGILITSPENTYYTTGYPAIMSAGNPILYALKNVLPFFVFVDLQGNVTLFCWAGASTGIEFDATRVITFGDKDTAFNKLEDFFRNSRDSIHTIGIESTCPYNVTHLVEKIFSPENIRTADEVIQKCRMVKSATEIEHIRSSTLIVEKTVSELMDLVQPGVRRPYLIHEAKSRMMLNGATGIGHVTISFGSSNPEVEIDEELESGKLVVLDLGAQYLGYASDNRRLMYTGKVPDGILDLHKRMCEIVDEIAAKLVPGVLFNDLYNLAINLYSKNNLDPFIPNVGHTMGLNTEEDWLYKNSPVIVEKGMVINLELYSLYKTGELIGDEETYVVGDHGSTQITTLSREIRSV
jgi:Xaa-Pro aminopeptidase